jgi:hypothetical protein
MSGLQAHVDEYLRLRRALGFKLKEEGRLLEQFVAYLEAAGANTVSSELAICWARLPCGVHPNLWAKRLSIARGFAGYLQTIDPATEIPPPDVFPTRRQRATPYLFSQQDICRLLREARGLRRPLRIGARTETVHPRIHDLRHRFAVQTLIDWQRSGVNIDEHIATLSTFLGHVSPADTYWYLSASPELMALAAERLHDRFGGVR